jgi:hypothetical protein
MRFARKDWKNSLSEEGVYFTPFRFVRRKRAQSTPDPEL